MKIASWHFFIFIVLFNSSYPVMAQNEDQAIVIGDPWVRPSQVENSAAYMTIDNTGSLLDQLISVQTDVCEWVELHRIDKIKGIFRMHPVEVIDIPSETETVLRPSGMHLMLMKLKHPLKVGEKVKLNLVFKRAGTLTIEAEVRHHHHSAISQEKEHSLQAEKKGA